MDGDSKQSIDPLGSSIKKNRLKNKQCLKSHLFLCRIIYII